MNEITMQEAIQQRIEDLLSAQQIGISELARRSGLKQSTVYDIAKGNTRNPSVLAVYWIAKGFGLTLSEFTTDVLFVRIKVEPMKRQRVKKRIKAQ